MNNSEGEMVEAGSQAGEGSATPGHTPQFTPGPWVAEMPSKVWQVNAHATKYFGIALLVERRAKHGYNSAEVEANARLIAAAPDLYTALVRVLPMVRACKHEDFSNMHGNEDTKTAALLNAMAVLSKALGVEKPSDDLSKG